MLYGWHLLTAPNSELVVLSWKKAVATVKRLTGSSMAEIIAHQDHGSVYTGAEYILAVLKEKCHLCYSRRGKPGDNAVNESFFSRLKEEWRDVFMEAQSFDELQKMVRKVIDYYNNERYHSIIALKAPLTFTKEQVGHLTVH
jgi:transposase InsO family protein